MNQTVAVYKDEPILEESWSTCFSDHLRSKSIQVKLFAEITDQAVADLSSCDGLMWRFTHSPRSHLRAKLILKAAEHGLGMLVWPNQRSAWHYDDKMAQYWLLSAIGAPQPRTNFFVNRTKALDWARSATYPQVFKLRGGASSQSVCLVKSFPEAERLIERSFWRGLSGSHRLDRIAHGDKGSLLSRLMSLPRNISREIWHSFLYGDDHLFEPRVPHIWSSENETVVMQEFLPNNEHDFRVTVIGPRAFAYRRFNRPQDFRASGSGIFDVNPEKIDLNAVRIAHEASKKLGFDCMAYDFLRDQNGELVILEISYTFVSRMVQKCPGYWDRDLKWHEGSVWPQDAICEDFIRLLQAKK